MSKSNFKLKWTYAFAGIYVSMQREQLETTAQEMRENKHQVPPSVDQLLHLIPYLAVVVIQDALELAEQYPTAHAHKILLNHSTFK